MSSFVHLHSHTQYSLLDGATDISAMYRKAVEDGMPALAITDHGNMFGVFSFVAEAAKYNHGKDQPVIKPIVGCEFYLVADRHKKQFSKINRDQRYHQLLLAKNAIGYKNLCQLTSLGFIEGLYGKYPRIDKELLVKYKEGLIATSCCLGAIIPKKIVHEGIDAAEAELRWWVDEFGEDFYIELQRHGLQDEVGVNEALLMFAKKYNIEVIATNDSHYLDQGDADTHDILLCVNTGTYKSIPIAKDFTMEEVDVRGTRFGFSNDQFYFKTSAEMKALFKDIPQAIENTLAIADKVELLNLKKDILLPNFEIPIAFKTQNEYLRHLTYQGAQARYVEINDEIRERLDFELGVIERMDFAGYFLIVSDIVRHGKEIGVQVGPGRGSAAGSAVAFCIGITNIDPLKYNLLFERFLNPDRKSMPDIDTDFDDVGRQKVIDYMIEKYGKSQVAQIVTYGTMAAKMSIKDVARVMELPIEQSNLLTKMIPDKLGINLNELLTAPLTGENNYISENGFGPDEVNQIKALRAILDDQSDPRSKILQEAMKLEGSIRNVGVHAAGVIIAPSNLMEILPVTVAKDAHLVVTQYDGKQVENAGVIKMDILGLKTLSIIKDSLEFIKENHGVDLDMETLPLDDTLTFELYQNGDTTGTFQFESDGMVKYLKELKPDRIEDLISMNALYRPGPMAYIPSYINRKNGLEQVEYDLPEMEKILKETYGITVYQEQVMQLARELAGFSRGDADSVRKAMGKKDLKTLAALKEKFDAGTQEKGFDKKICDKIWKDWEAFASYAFNKSHATCYAYLAYHTAYLKAHYRPEFYAANLKHHNSIDKISQFIEACKASGIKVLGPDINESKMSFSVDPSGVIRFGLSAIKGVGEGPVLDILEARANGRFTDIYDFVKRVNNRSINKKTLESLVYSGALDVFGVDRAAYFGQSGKYDTFIENLSRYASSVTELEEETTGNLFGNDFEIVITEPKPPSVTSWSNSYRLEKEKEVIGLYASGHPLDPYKLELEMICNLAPSALSQLEKPTGGIRMGGLVTAAVFGTNRRDEPYCRLELADFVGSTTFFIAKDLFFQSKAYLEVGAKLFVEGEVRNRWKTEDLEFNPQRIKLLDSVSEESFSSIQLHIAQDQINDKFTHQLKDILNAHKGIQKARLTVFDLDSNVDLNLNVPQTVQIGQELINELKVNKISYRIVLK